jgi:hypothetical protein
MRPVRRGLMLRGGRRQCRTGRGLGSASAFDPDFLSVEGHAPKAGGFAAPAP